MIKTAILIDGGYIIKRLKYIYPDLDLSDASAVSCQIYKIALDHLCEDDNCKNELHRIFFYDCPPLNKKVHYPISHKPVDFNKTDHAKFRDELHKNLKKKRKLALRLGHLTKHTDAWQLKPNILKNLLKRKMSFDELEDKHFKYDVRQKGVDMKIGLDIASLSYKKLVDQIILIAGDADFVSAAKLARKEGIDFVLDPMWGNIDDRLNEHTDGIRSVCPNPLTHQKDQTSNNANMETPILKSNR